MIKANELRVGNFLKFNNFIGGEEKIIQIDLRFFASWAGGRSPKEMKFDEELSNYYTGIELTPEVLLAAGFQNFDNTWIVGRISEWEVHLMKYGFVITHETCDPRIWNIPINTLHGVQNAIFALTGTELEIDLTKAIK